MEQLENAPLCTSASPAAGIFNGQSVSAQSWGVSRLPPTRGKGKTPPQDLQLSPEKPRSRGSKTTASKSIPEERCHTSLREGSPPSSVRSWHKGKKPEEIKYSLQIQAEEVRVLWGQPLHCKTRD